MARVAIVGAGFAGLACAARLEKAGIACAILDKGRGPGGRAATRRADGGLQFDHGLPCFTACSTDFAAVAAAWQAKGRAALWPGRFGRLDANGFEDEMAGSAPRWVGVPKMNALMAGDGGTVQFGEEVVEIRRGPEGWILTTKTGGLHGPFDGVVLAVPSNQAVPLLAPVSGLAELAAKPVYAPAWVGMAAFAAPLPAPFDAADGVDGPLSLIVRDGSKPGRPSLETWVMHGAGDWSREHLEADKEEMAPRLLSAFRDLMGRAGCPVPEPDHLAAHRWRYALVETPLGAPCLMDPGAHIGACGDWCLGSTVEDAWRSGDALGAALGERITRAV